MLDETKELITRFAAGKLKEVPAKVTTSDMLQVIDKVYTLRRELNKTNVSAALHRIYPDYTFPAPNQVDLTDDELMAVVVAQQAKQKLIKVESKLQEALLFNSNKANHNWDKTVEEISKELVEGSTTSSDVLTFADLNFDESDRVICTTGFPLLDFYLGGGYEESSYSIWYGACLTGDTLVEINDNGKCHTWTLERLFHTWVGWQKKGLKMSLKRGNFDRGNLRIKSVDEGLGKVYYNKVKNVYCNGIKKVFEVILTSGEKIKSTLEHKYYTPGGYKTLGELSVGSEVYAQSEENYKSPPPPRLEVMVKHHPHGSPKKINGYLYFRRMKYHFIYEANLNGLSYEDYISRLNSGELEGLRFIPKGYDVHHINGDHTDNSLGNLTLLTRSEHVKLHCRENPQHCATGRKLKISKIDSISELGDEVVFDIECESPNNNYIANNIVVHNSNMGKSSVVTAYLAATAIRQGKMPLIISLEGSAQRLMKRILSILIGCWGQDISTLSSQQKEDMLKLAKKLENIPIVKSNAKSVYAMRKYINTFKPDIIIYDQLTISGGGREWTEMAKVSEMLKKLTLDTGIPVVALTQSDGKNYGGESAKKDEEGNEAVEYIKYAQAIFEDATTVIQIGKYAQNPETGRVLTLRKSKNDETAKLLPISIVIEMIETGFKELGIKDGYKPLITTDKILSGTIKKEVKRIEAEEFSPVEEVVTYTEHPHKEVIKVSDSVPSEYSCNMFSQNTVDTIPDRLMSYSEFASDRDLQILSYYLKNNKANYGKVEDPTYCVSFYDARDLGDTYSRYYCE